MTIRHSRRPDHITAGRAFLLSVLNSIARDCAAHGEPDLSVLVVRSQTALPGMVDGHPVEPENPASTQRWHAELTRVRQYRWPAQ